MAELPEPAIGVCGLRKCYGEVTAVDGVDLEIRRGEVFALLGPNGAGKTTIVEILEGYRDPDFGAVRVLGAEPARAGRAWRSRIGIVLQSASDLPELTVREVLRHFAAYYPAPRDPDQLIEMVGLAGKSAARLRQLSGGQRRRVDVALGILGRPELLFLDEPTTGFDPQARRQSWELIRQLASDGTTILLTTHYLDEAEALADRVAVLAQGAIRAIGTPLELGGRQDAATIVSWQDGSGRKSITTRQPTRTLAELAAHFGGEIPRLSVAQPSLEDIYLQLIGAPALDGAMSGARQ